MKHPRNFSTMTNSTVSDEESGDEGSEDALSVSHAIHYFAIGSMTNMTALALRELTPISSQPAILKGHRMVFRGKGGMATAEKEGEYEKVDGDASEYPFDCIHGVLHLLSGPQMKILDDFEGGYKRRVCKVLLYDGKTEVSAYVYQMDRLQWQPTPSLQTVKKTSNIQTIQHELPSERYVDVIAQGCESHGVDPKWVNFIRQHQCIPRKSASEFCSFSSSMTTATIPIIPWEQVRACNGIRGAKMWIVINNKVLEFTGDVTSFFPYGYFVKHKIGGTDFTVRFAKSYFDPKYLHPTTHYGSGGGSGSGGHGSSSFSSITSAAQLSNEHRAWIEDQFACPPPVLASSKWALVGVVDVSLPVSDPALLSRNSTFGMRRTKLVHCRTYSSHNNSGNISPVTSIGEGIADISSSDAVFCGTKTGITTTVPSNVIATEILDLTADINTGYNHFFISGTTSGIWIIPDGLHAGQTLYVRKTALTDFDTPVTIRIRNQNLCSPNQRSMSYMMNTDVYYLSWCWDGACWFLEQIGRAEL